MSPYAETLANARIDAIKMLVDAMNDAEDPAEKRRCAVAILNAPEPNELDDEIEWTEDEDEGNDDNTTEGESEESQDDDADEQDAANEDSVADASDDVVESDAEDLHDNEDDGVDDEGDESDVESRLLPRPGAGGARAQLGGQGRRGCVQSPLTTPSLPDSTPPPDGPPPDPEPFPPIPLL